MRTLLLNGSVPQFPHRSERIGVCTYCIGSWEGLCDPVPVTCLGLCPVPSALSEQLSVWPGELRCLDFLLGGDFPEMGLGRRSA